VIDYNAVIDRELRKAGKCKKACSPHLGIWTSYPKCFMVVVEHAGYKIPFVIERLLGEDSPRYETTIKTVLKAYSEQAATWHVYPGSEDDWRKRLAES
jgi:hypothetical protein